jgi:hypothetical protein
VLFDDGARAYQPPPLRGPGPKSHPFAANLLENIERRGWRVDRIVPIHGRIVPFAELVVAAPFLTSADPLPASATPQRTGVIRIFPPSGLAHATANGSLRRRSGIPD